MILIPNELWPYAELPNSLRNYEAYYNLVDTAENIAGDVEWESLYVKEYDSLLVRGRIAARMLRVIRQCLHLLVGSRAELEPVEVSPQCWTNFHCAPFGVARWFPIPPGYRSAFEHAAKCLGLDFPTLPASRLPVNVPPPYGKWHSAVDRIIESPVGLFRYTGGVPALTQIVCSVRRCIPGDYRIVVVVRTSEFEKQLKRHVQRLRDSGFARDCGEIVITQTQRLQHLQLQAGKTIVLVSDAAMVGTQAAAEVLGRIPHARLYGFMGRPGKPEPYIQRRIEAFFGTSAVELHNTHDGCSPADVVLQRNRLSVPGRRNLPASELKRVHIWRNPRRNRLIERISMFLSVPKTQKALKSRDFEPSLLALRRSLPPDPSILILVESDLHLTELDGLCSARWGRATLDGGRLCWLAGAPDAQVVIATFPVAAQLRKPFDVVVRADGGPGAPDVIQRLVRSNLERVTHLIDVQDRGAPQLRDWSKSRINKYQQLGWSEPPNQTLELVDRLVAAAKG